MSQARAGTTTTRHMTGKLLSQGSEFWVHVDLKGSFKTWARLSRKALFQGFCSLLQAKSGPHPPYISLSTGLSSVQRQRSAVLPVWQQRPAEIDVLFLLSLWFFIRLHTQE